jgi:hypothetical protein
VTIAYGDPVSVDAETSRAAGEMTATLLAAMDSAHRRLEAAR